MAWHVSGPPLMLYSVTKLKLFIPRELTPFIRQLWRFKWLSIAVTAIGCAIGWTYVATLPPRYESSTRVYINVDPLLTPILHGLAIEENPARQIDFLQRTLLSRANLEQIIKLSDLDIPSEGGKTQPKKEDLMADLARGVSLRPQTENMISIGYANQNPVVAKNVVQAVLTVFSENATAAGRNQMENAKRFIGGELALYENQLRGAERRRADFRAQHGELLPGVDGAVSRLETGRRDIERMKVEITDIRARRDSLKRELDGTPKSLSVDATGPQVIINGHPSGYRARADAARAKLDELRMRFTDLHPDIIALQKEIAELDAKAAKEPLENRKVEIANPLYEQVKVRLVEVETELASAERRLNEPKRTKSY